MKSLRFLACLAAAPAAFAAGASTHLLHNPAFNGTQIVFAYAGDLWSVNRQGGTAVRLTSGMGIETLPYFSPDGKILAFTGEYDGNIDVYTMPAAGGVPKRITYHPGADYAAGWTPDGRNILFRSNRQSFSRYTQLFRVSKDGGLPEALPLPMAFAGAYSPDGTRLAYAPLDGGQFGRTPERWVAWRRYRGGDASYLWIVNLADLGIQKIPRTDSNDINPMWAGDKVYFLSDRNGRMTLFRYDPATQAVTELIRNTGPDIRSASAGPGAIVYEQFGQIGLYDLASGKTRTVPVEMGADVSEVRPRFQNVEQEIRAARISPTGVRAVFEAHGEILTAPAEKGDIRDLTRTPGVMERTPAWSPDGQSIAYFSDESGEYALHIQPQGGEGPARKITLAGHSAFYFAPHWSPDSQQIAFNDNQLHLWTVEVGSGRLTQIDSDYFYPYGSLERDIAWSPDSKWIAYDKFLPNRLHVIELYSLSSGQSTQITDGLSDARYPGFDPEGKYLYFTASTNYGPGAHPLDMTSDEHQVTRSVYALVLRADAPNPVAPESDEEKPPARAEAKPEGKPGETTPLPVRIDLAGAAQRTVAVPIPARNYAGLAAGRAGTIYVLEEAAESLRGGGQGGSILSKFDLKTRKLERLADRVRSFDLSFNGEKMLLQLARGAEEPAPGAEREPPQWVIAPAGAPVKPGEGVLKLAGMEVKVDPVAEWTEMYHEVWRIERSYFYDPHLHGLDAAAAEKEYEPYLPTLASRDDLNYIFQEMLGEITSSHLRGGGGTIPRGKRVRGGLLGADFEIDNGHYRFRRIYTGESWNPELRAPLSGPGITVKQGEYLLEINGHPLSPAEDISAWLEETAGKRIRLRVGPDPSGANAREITVEPVESEQGLRNLAWIEGNRRKVEELSGSKLAYVYMPDTGEAGLTSFNRYFFAQVDKQGVILDERFNGGGQVADYVIDVLNRPLLSYNAFRYGAIQRSPAGSIPGPKVMIINEAAGSGGDMMPWMFRYTKTGTLVGKRTWGGLIGVLGFPLLMDGGTITAPNVRIFSPSGEWIAENTGIAPDVEVELDPKLVASGHDPQLERAVSIALEQLRKNPPPEPHRPAYPDYQHPSGAGGSRASKTVQ
ncbi:MAG TPA: PDZ domain-containing protein [Bryobacteraceae bacterium]|nr:PDZ domain-containing protein [Bryobacteraceae bacterium]